MHRKYTQKKMGEVWDESADYEYWLRVELAVAKAQGAPAHVYECLKNYARIDVERVHELNKIMDHPMNAFLAGISQSIEMGMQQDRFSQGQIAEVLSYIHKGLTTYDIWDTALALRLKVGIDYLLQDLDMLLAVVWELAEKYKHTPQIGRTHLQHAEPITFGLKLLNLYYSLSIHRTYLRSNRHLWEVGKVSGAVGTFSHFDPKIEEMTGEYLGISMAKVSSQIVSREGMAYLMTALAAIASTLAKYAKDIEHLSSTEVQEVFEEHEQGKIGSSAMPHKSRDEFANANKCERIYSLAKVVRACSHVALENIDIRHEQDLTQSASERITISGSLTLVDYMIDFFTRVVSSMRVDAKRMAKNIWLTGGLTFSGHVRKALMDKGMGREEATALVTRLCKETKIGPRKKLDFKRMALQDTEVRTLLTPQEIENCFDLALHLRNVDKIFERVYNVDNRDRIHIGGRHV